MKIRVFWVLMIFASLFLGAVQVFAQSGNNKLAIESARSSAVGFNVAVANAGGTLTVSAPDGRVFRNEFPAGAAVEFSVIDSEGARLPDGNYNYELRLTPASLDKEALKAARGKDDDPEARRAARRPLTIPDLVQSGSFAILNGQIIVAGAKEEPASRASSNSEQAPKMIRTTSSGNTVSRLRHHRLSLLSMPDQVVPDDFIVQGSACIGFDCVNNESFGTDTIRLKENNTRIKFDDTSISTGFPANDWQLTANDQPSGGASKFSIEDITGSKVPFTITAGAPTNSVFVDSTGRVGFRTNTPGLDLHMHTSNTPAVRFEQDNAAGFNAQTWDVAGNEANFFVRDVTNGSRLSFRIRPGAPTSSLDISANGNVGVGIQAPTQKLHMFNAGTTDNVLLSMQNGTRQWTLGINGPSDFFRITDQNAGLARLTILNNGRVGIGTTAPDQVFSVNGDASKTGGGSWQSFSDERLKNIFGNYNRGLSAVMRLQPLRYEYKPDNALGLKSEGEHVGFGAKALETVIPEAVTKNAEGYLMVNNDPIIWTMLNAIKEQQQEIKDQQKEIEALKVQVQQLKTKSRRHRR